MGNFLSRFFQEPQQERKFTNIKDNKYHFDAIMELAYKMSCRNPAHLPKLVKLLARKIQSNALCAALYYDTKEEIDNNVPEIKPGHLLFDFSIKLNNEDNEFNDFMVKLEYHRPLELRTDIIMPWPWQRQDIIVNLCDIPVGGWRQDINHIVEYWLPIGVGFVNCGNHSIMCGIINGEGVISDYSALDISETYKHVKCDGKHYMRTSDYSIISEVSNLEFAAIYEIGRLMVEHGVCA